MSWLQKIIIINNNAITLSSLGIREDIVEENNLVLYPESYSVLNNNNVIELGLTSSGTFLQVKRVLKELDLVFRYPEANISQAIYLIAKKSYEDKTPITIRDYRKFEDEDYDQGYSDRVGFIQLPIKKGEIIIDEVSETRYHPDGFEINFKETEIRKY